MERLHAMGALIGGDHAAQPRRGNDDQQELRELTGFLVRELAVWVPRHVSVYTSRHKDV